MMPPGGPPFGEPGIRRGYREEEEGRGPGGEAGSPARRRREKVSVWSVGGWLLGW